MSSTSKWSFKIVLFQLQIFLKIFTKGDLKPALSDLKHYLLYYSCFHCDRNMFKSPDNVEVNLVFFVGSLSNKFVTWIVGLGLSLTYIPPGTLLCLSQSIRCIHMTCFHRNEICCKNETFSGSSSITKALKIPTVC